VTTDTQRYRIYEGIGPPPGKSGPPKRWGFLPLETINVDDFIELTMTEQQAHELASAIRSYAGRVARATSRKFSVRITDYGVGIWRTL
jgi:hypothetical protein